MAGPVPAIHEFRYGFEMTWMPGTRPGMTRSPWKDLADYDDNA